VGRRVRRTRPEPRRARDTRLTLWDVATGAPVRTLRGHVGCIWGVAISPDGRLAASASADGTARLWDLASAEEVCRFSGHAGAVCSIAFSPDGRRIASGDEDGVVKIWSAHGGDEIRSFAGHGGPVQSVAFSPDGGHVLSRSRGPDLGARRRHDDVRLREVESGRQMWSVPCVGRSIYAGAAFSADGRLVACGDGETASVMDAASGTGLRTLRHGNRASVESTAFSPDGAFAVSGDGEGHLTLWDASGWREARTLSALPANRPPSWIECVSTVDFSRDGRVVLAATLGGGATVWDTSWPERRRASRSRVERAAIALRDKPDDAAALGALGEWYALHRAWDVAAPLLEEARRHDPQISPLPLARCYSSLGREGPARQEYRRAAAADPADGWYLELCARGAGEGRAPPATKAARVPQRLWYAEPLNATGLAGCHEWVRVSPTTWQERLPDARTVNYRVTGHTTLGPRRGAVVRRLPDGREDVFISDDGSIIARSNAFGGWWSIMPVMNVTAWSAAASPSGAELESN
jgi:outer membrane protein assembly factor BamB